MRKSILSTNKNVIKMKEMIFILSHFFYEYKHNKEKLWGVGRGWRESVILVNSRIFF